ncbi:MAG: CHASE2 domain-containing protein, partial [Candidatus Zixiibacteriota bacterium]
MKKRQYYIFYSVITLLVIGLKLNDIKPLERIEWKLQDILYEFKQNAPASGKVALVQIDDLSVSQIGPWPWSEEVLSDLVAAVGTAEPRTVLLDLDATDPNSPNSPNSKRKKSNKSKKSNKKLDQIVSQQLLWMKNVTVSYDVMTASAPSADVTNPQFLFRNALVTNSDVGLLSPEQALPVRTALLPDKEISDAAARLGFRHTAIDEDGVLRYEPLVMNYNGYYYPSASLVAAAHFLRVSPESIVVNGGENIALLDRTIPTNERGEMLLNFPTGGAGFKSYSATDILNERVDFSVLNNQLVVITLSMGSHTEYYKSPI